MNEDTATIAIGILVIAYILSITIGGIIVFKDKDKKKGDTEWTL